MKTVKQYRELIENREGKARAGDKLTWGDIWDIQESIIKKAMEDMRDECSKAARPVDESLADVILRMSIR